MTFFIFCHFPQDANILDLCVNVTWVLSLGRYLLLDKKVLFSPKFNLIQLQPCPMRKSPWRCVLSSVLRNLTSFIWKKLTTVLKVQTQKGKYERPFLRLQYLCKTHKLFELRKLHTPFSSFLQQLARPLSDVQLIHINTEAQSTKVCHLLFSMPMMVCPS